MKHTGTKTAANPHTGDSMMTKPLTQEFEQGYDRIFKKTPEEMPYRKVVNAWHKAYPQHKHSCGMVSYSQQYENEFGEMTALLGNTYCIVYEDYQTHSRGYCFVEVV